MRSCYGRGHHSRPTYDQRPGPRYRGCSGRRPCFLHARLSTVGIASFDEWAKKSDLNRIRAVDISVMNRTMRTRSPLKAWTDFTEATEDLPALAALGLDWSLLEMELDDWTDRHVAGGLTALLRAVRGKHRNLAVMSKVFYLKRPALFPILDRLIGEQVGWTPGIPAITLIEHLRQEGRENLKVLSATQSHLADLGIERSLVRILDVLLWVSHPAAGLSPKLGGWEHRFGPADR